MKLTLALALLFTSTLAFADQQDKEHTHDANDPAASATPMTGDNTKATAKKRLRHVGKNIEKLGDKAGKKAGVKNVNESSEPNAAEVPAAATPHSH